MTRPTKVTHPIQPLHHSIVRWASGLVALLLAVILAYGAAWITLPRWIVLPDVGYGGSIPLSIVHNGSHADLLLPAQAAGEDLRRLFPPSAFPMADPDPVAISIGWGHQDFYLNTPTWADLDPITAMEALIGIGDTALHVTYWPYWPDFGEDSALIFIGQDQYRALVAEIVDSISPPEDSSTSSGSSATRIDAPGYGSWDAFFKATGRYHAFHTCNGWVARRLHQAGLPAPLWTPGPEALLNAFGHASSRARP